MNPAVIRSRLVLHPDPTRVLARPFRPTTRQRVVSIGAQVMALPDAEVTSLLHEVEADFGERHVKIREFLIRRFGQMQPMLRFGPGLSEERQLLLGAYFTQEYALEAAALFNPSIVPHPDQSDVPAGSLRFILSLRATGEGHISSITFRTGHLDDKGEFTIQSPTRFCLEPFPVPNASYEKALFSRKLHELGLLGALAHRALEGVGDAFTLDQLAASLRRTVEQLDGGDHGNSSAASKILALAHSNYEVQFDRESRVSERVLFPVTPSQRNGIEDARFVRFDNGDGTFTYYATYTAYDGRLILPQFLETSDFLHFKFITLNGPAARNKGMALFPRKIGGKYVMLGREDYENIYVVSSDHLHFWHSSKLVLKPVFPWEFVQLGNCGSPVETDEGWLVLSHGVGPMRRYCIGAFLLDRDDPTRVIGRLREPLIRPEEHEREGYVPNVVYSCGNLLHGRTLVIPYAMCDFATTFATVSIDDVLAAME